MVDEVEDKDLPKSFHGGQWERFGTRYIFRGLGEEDTRETDHEYWARLGYPW